MTKRGPTPSLLSGSNGRPNTVFARKARPCSRCSRTIYKEEKCFEVPKIAGGFSNNKTYCRACFKEVLIKSREDLEAAESLL